MATGPRPDTGSAVFSLPKQQSRWWDTNGSACTIQRSTRLSSCRWPYLAAGRLEGRVLRRRARSTNRRLRLGCRGRKSFYFNPRNKIAPERGHEEAERPPTRASKNRKPRPGEAGLRAEGRGRVGGHVHSVWRQRDTPMTRSPVSGGARPSLLRPPASSLEQPGLHLEPV